MSSRLVDFLGVIKYLRLMILSSAALAWLAEAGLVLFEASSNGKDKVLSFTEPNVGGGQHGRGDRNSGICDMIFDSPMDNML